jgi:hypothetical protein
MRTPRINLDKLVRSIVLDISLLKWFATSGGRRLAAISAISLQRTDGDPAVLDFLELHCAPQSTQPKSEE